MPTATSKRSDLHLADLHERAAAAGIEGYRKMRRNQLLEALGESDSPAATAAPEGPGGEDEGVVVEATVLDDAEDEPVELDSAGRSEDRDEEEPAAEPVAGVLEITRQRYAFLRLTGLEPGDGDVYVSAAQVRRCELRSGDEVAGPAREPRRGERHRALVHVDTVNGAEPLSEERPDFDGLPAIQPERRLEPGDDLLARAVDLLAPLAYGQRILVRSAPRSGRTTLLRAIARGAAAHETARVIVLLIDERPEEATSWREEVPVADFAIATAEMAPIEQLRVTELALERARRLAEAGTDAVLICDSLTRLAIAAGGPTEVKRLFGSGRNLAGGGSLTVLATVLEDGGDEGEAERAIISTESSLVTLDPELAAAGVVPALRAAECRVSNEEQLREAEELDAARRLRSLLADLKPSDAAALLHERIEDTSSNEELLRGL